MLLKYLCLIFMISVLNGKADPGFMEDTVDSQETNAVDKKIHIKFDKDLDDGENCWMKLDAGSHFKVMDALDEKYKHARQAYHDSLAEELDKKLLAAILTNQGAAYRASHKTKGETNLIPSGLNLGGYTMMKLKDTVLFFHRTKLRNDTRFRVNSLHTDLMNMSLSVGLSLNDLHIVGAYERCTTFHDSSILYHTPAFGEIGILLTNVGYKMEGRLRTIHDRLIVESIDSELIIEDDVLITYLFMNDSDTTLKMKKNNLEDFLDKMKTDFDLWLKDYFNDYFMYFKLENIDPEIQEYDKTRTLALNEYTDFAINKFKQRLSELGAINVKAPNFTILSVPNLQISLTEGVVRGLDTMYRRSVATGLRHKNIRHIDALIGFSDLKVEYKFDATLPVGVPPLVGHIILTADEMIAHMEISMVKDPESIDVKFDFVQQISPQSLTVEGPANRLIASYKHILETQIMSIMSSTLIYDIRMLSTLPKCQPSLYGYDKPKGHASEETIVKTGSKYEDYVLYKNDSVELEVPDPSNPSLTKRIELKRQEKFIYKKLD